MLNAVLVKEFFYQGLTHGEISDFMLKYHNIIINRRQVRYILSKAGLFRRRHFSPLVDVTLFIQKQLQGSGRMNGYRFMHKKCIRNGLRIPLHTVRLIIKHLDPHGVQTRRAKRLQRRQYNGRGPNFLWHIDSYDKLKRFGICINGCIDGYSRKLIWLEATSNTNNPLIIAGHFIANVAKVGGCPRIVRMDRGSENVRLRDMQEWLRRDGADSFSGRNSVMCGRSTANQRIEQYWSFLRKHWTQFWLNMFKELSVAGYYNGSWLEKNLIQFVFLHHIQVEI